MEQKRMTETALRETVGKIGGGHYATLRTITEVSKMNAAAVKSGIKVFCDSTSTVRIGVRSNDNLARVAEYKETHEVGNYTCKDIFEYEPSHRFKFHKETKQKYLVYHLDKDSRPSESHFIKVENGIETEISAEELKSLRQPSAYKSYGIKAECGDTEKSVKIENVVSLVSKETE